MARFFGPGWLRESALRGFSRVPELAAHGRYSCPVAALAVAGMILRIFTNCCYAWALFQPVSLVDMALVLPFVTLSGILPVSLGGIGVKEGAFVVGLSAVGLSQEGALAVALLNRVVVLAVATTGGFLFPFRRKLLRT